MQLQITSIKYFYDFSNNKILSVKQLALIASVMLYAFVNHGLATTYIKAANTTNLNTSGSWTVAGHPSSASDFGKWDNTVTGPNTTVLGADMTWGGIIIANPGGWITINSGNTLTIGTSSGIDMGAATAGSNLTLNIPVVLGADQTWNVNSGLIFYMDGVVSGAHSLTKNGNGELCILNNTNTYSGGTTVNAGYIFVGNYAQENVAAFGTGTVTVNSGGIIRFTPGVTSTEYDIANSFILNGGTIIGQDGLQHLATGGSATFAIGASGGTLEPTYSTKDIYIDGILSGSTTLGPGARRHNGNGRGRPHYQHRQYFLRHRHGNFVRPGLVAQSRQ